MVFLNKDKTQDIYFLLKLINPRKVLCFNMTLRAVSQTGKEPHYREYSEKYKQITVSQNLIWLPILDLRCLKECIRTTMSY